MKKVIIVCALAAALYFGLDRNGAVRLPTRIPTADRRISDAQRKESGRTSGDQASGSRITGEGRVTKLLPDDNEGRRHQRFLVTLLSGRTLLVAHNIDLAPRIASLKVGDVITFNGVYESNDKGGVIHWTHRDPSGRHPGGWLKHAGRIYQ